MKWVGSFHNLYIRVFFFNLKPQFLFFIA
jgi:hypothetical protein